MAVAVEPGDDNLNLGRLWATSTWDGSGNLNLGRATSTWDGSDGEEGSGAPARNRPRTSPTLAAPPAIASTNPSLTAFRRARRGVDHAACRFSRDPLTQRDTWRTAALFLTSTDTNMQILDGRYRLVRRLGTGGMGAVYVAQRLDNEGALSRFKVINAGELTKSPGLVKRFYREARATGALDAPNVVRVFDAGADPSSGSPYMVMELLDGEDLHRFSREVGALDPYLALRIAAQVCRGLAKAHEAGVVHRDIKAANLFLARTGGGVITVKILDFGIAKTSPGAISLGETAGNGLTHTGMVLGSPLYMSPEQARGDKQVDHRSDLWSLGVVLFRMLAGRTPYQHVEGWATSSSPSAPARRRRCRASRRGCPPRSPRSSIAPCATTRASASRARTRCSPPSTRCSRAATRSRRACSSGSAPSGATWWRRASSRGPRRSSQGARRQPRQRR